MNAPLDSNRISVLQNMSVIRASWTEEERKKRASAARKYSRLLAELIIHGDKLEAQSKQLPEEISAHRAPTYSELERIAVAQ